MHDDYKQCLNKMRIWAIPRENGHCQISKSRPNGVKIRWLLGTNIFSITYNDKFYLFYTQTIILLSNLLNIGNNDKFGLKMDILEGDVQHVLSHTTKPLSLKQESVIVYMNDKFHVIEVDLPEIFNTFIFLRVFIHGQIVTSVTVTSVTYLDPSFIDIVGYFANLFDFRSCVTNE